MSLGGGGGCGGGGVGTTPLFVCLFFKTPTLQFAYFQVTTYACTLACINVNTD